MGTHALPDLNTLALRLHVIARFNITNKSWILRLTKKVFFALIPSYYFVNNGKHPTAFDELKFNPTILT